MTACLVKGLKRVVALFAGWYVIRGYTWDPTAPQEWFRKAIQRPEFQDKPYLNFASYSNYLKLNKVAKVIDRVESWRRARGLEPSQVRVLDIGCGPYATYSCCLASLGYCVVGVDINEDLPAVAAERIKGLEDRIELVVADALEYLQRDIPSRGFDVVLAIDTLEHLEQPEALCQALYKAVCPSGILLVVAPDGFSEVEIFYTPLARFLKRVALGERWPRWHYHIQRFSLRRVRRMLMESGFEYAFVSGMFTTRFPFLLCFAFGFRGFPTYLNIKATAMLPPLMTNSWLVVGTKRLSPGQ